MVNLAANLSMLYCERPFLERFEAASTAGFSGVEFQFPYPWPAAQIAERIDATGLQQVLFNLPPGNWDEGERGLACLPHREMEFQDTVGHAIDYAKELGTPRLHCMAGILPDGGDAPRAKERFIGNLRFAARACAQEGLMLMIEPINTFDVPGYFLNRSSQALKILAAVNEPNIFLQYDIYHMHRMGDDMAKFIARNIDAIGHFQIAGHPGRHEPDDGEVPYAETIEAIESTGFEGWIGCEYLPAQTTEAGLKWARPWL
ncbi:MAG: 2-oxo-tetronate isomerase [Hyphomicrobiales bacterium]